MAKAATPGRVKTRLTSALTTRQAAQVHRAMLVCVLARVLAWQQQDRRVQLVVAMASGDGRTPDEALRDTIGHADEVVALWSASRAARILPQGRGDLGDRLLWVWRTAGGGPAMFLGADSPDVPQAAWEATMAALDQFDAAVGPADDGGYWTLAARQPEPALLTGIDWGTSSVYDQTSQKARDAGISLTSLPAWHDVDTPADLEALRHRLAQTSSPLLQQLRQRLDVICEGQLP